MGYQPYDFHGGFRMNRFFVFLAGMFMLAGPAFGATVELADGVALPVGQVASLPAVTITAEVDGELSPAAPVWLILPAGFVYDETVNKMDVAGSASGKVPPIASYAMNGLFFFVPISAPLTAGESIVLTGLGIRAVGPEAAVGVISLDVNGDNAEDAISAASLTVQ